MSILTAAILKKVLPSLIGVAIGVAGGWSAGKWWYESDALAALEKGLVAEAGLLEDKKEIKIVYRDRVKIVEKHIENTEADKRECLTDDDLKLFNAGKVDP